MLRSPPSGHAERTFRGDDAGQLRRFVQAFGSRAGLAGTALTDLVLAVSEAAACAAARGPATTRVRLWFDGALLYCEVRGDAPVQRRVPGGPSLTVHLGEEDELRYRLLRQVCDYFRVASAPDATRVLLTVTLRRAGRDPSGRAEKPRPR